MNISSIWQLFMAVALVTPLTICFAGTNGSGSSSDNMLLLDSLGRVVAVPTNEVPSELRPATGSGLDRQIPNPTAGSSMPLELLQRLCKDTNGFQFFSAMPPQLMSYLASQDEYGNTAVRPGALFSFVPLDGPVQDGKYWLSEYGFRYSLQQTFTFVSMTGVKKGDGDLDYYTLDLKAKWNLYSAPDSGNAGWISSQIEAKTPRGNRARPETDPIRSIARFRRAPRSARWPRWSATTRAIGGAGPRRKRTPGMRSRAPRVASAGPNSASCSRPATTPDSPRPASRLPATPPCRTRPTRTSARRAKLDKTRLRHPWPPTRWPPPRFPTGAALP